MPELISNDRTLYWREAGTGAPALLIHCSLAHSGVFRGFMDALGDICAFRAPDLPGHGRTGHIDGQDTQDEALDDALRLLADRPPAHVIGHSFGGTVALRAALEAPARVASLTLIEPVQFSLLAAANPEAHARDTAANAGMIAGVRAGDWHAAAEAFLSRWGDGRPLAALQEQQRAQMIACLPLLLGGDTASLHDGAARFVPEDLTRIECPVLLLAGARSDETSHDILDVIADRLPDCRRTTIAGAGHMLPLTHTAETVVPIRAFVEAHP